MFLLRPPGGIALALAIAALARDDGVAVFGHLRRWAWTDAFLCRRTQGFFAAVAGVEFDCFLALARSNEMM